MSTHGCFAPLFPPYPIAATRWWSLEDSCPRRRRLLRWRFLLRVSLRPGVGSDGSQAGGLRLFDRSVFFYPAFLKAGLFYVLSLYPDSDVSADACMTSSLCIRALEALACNIKLV